MKLVDEISQNEPRSNLRLHESLIANANVIECLGNIGNGLELYQQDKSAKPIEFKRLKSRLGNLEQAKQKKIRSRIKQIAASATNQKSQLSVRQKQLADLCDYLDKAL